MTLSHAPKIALFLANYIDQTGCSALIRRYDLPAPFAYTSGDGLFRSDATLGKKYKFFRFSNTLDYKKKSRCWILSDQDKQNLENIHSDLNFEKNGLVCEFIQFYGFAPEEVIDMGIRTGIRRLVCAKRCVACGRQDDIQCDHKNDLKNDPRVMDTQTQTIDDFQPLCRGCNDLKRSALQHVHKTGTRYGATQLGMGYKVDFVQGDETFDKEDPNWYVGTYWGDCLAFRQGL